ncbi:PREDICTED: endogenous retrovirus group 3 member 1 Env polyprotein-like [Thamnophis sirtalis]|uniref:Endogenous retrovirus group 3 member 1 Env polyprotein-like n=1 Tax=Thamnophis sirtalis TaxID=35019 RepID=A0A6I9YB44_9SAUR|nr:PREDICTED: endogenous retrovirus group 3 member 1 Env polyprotein-like [Thamnophis sirtalis]
MTYKRLAITRNNSAKASSLEVWITNSNYLESYQCRAGTGTTTLSRTAIVTLEAQGRGTVVLEPIMQQGVDECGPCLTKARVGPRTIVTLIYHTQAPSDCTPQKQTCVSNGTMYNYCIQKNQLVCYQPTTPVRLKVTVWAGLALLERPKESKLYHLTSVTALKQGQQPITVTFGVCAAMDRVAYRGCGSQGWRKTYHKNHKYLCPWSRAFCQRCPEPSRDLYPPCTDRQDQGKQCKGWDCVCHHTGGGYPTSTHLGCPYISNFRRLPNTNSVTFEESRNHPAEESYGIGIDGDGSDPLAYITIRVETLKEGEVKSLGWSVYDNLRKLEEPLPLSSKAVNLFVEMAEEVAKALTVKNCFVCGGTNMGEKWPWEALEADPEVYNNMTLEGNLTKRIQHSDIVWTLTTNLVGRNCFSRNGSYPVGHLICLGEWDATYSNWSSPSNIRPPSKFNLTLLQYLKKPQTPSVPWEAPDNMYWICGTLAYEVLPKDWSGSCVLGWIKPSFFLLPIQSRQVLGVLVYDSVGPSRQRREAATAFSNFPCKELAEYEKSDMWSSERIVCTYGRATWAEDGSWGYRTPIYMINRIMRLQAVLDLAAERIDKSLNILSTATDKLRTAVYQNRLALDYLLAREGGDCGKFNLSNCCLQIDEMECY